MSGSKIFVRHKALGYVSNHVPVITRYIHKRKENLLVTCIGKSFHTYGSSHLRLLNASPIHPEEISCIEGNNRLVFTAAGNVIYAWRRGNELKHKYEGHRYAVKHLLCFGLHLVSADESGHVKVWEIKTATVFAELNFNNDKFRISAIMHPHTYLNKILLGSEQGYLQLWNLLTSKLVYSFQGWGSGVSIIVQSPAVDIVGIGLKNGRIILHNLKYDEVLMEFKQDWGIVTSLAFRLDDAPFLISGTMQGHLILWNLDEKKVFSQILHAHSKAVTGLRCFPSEPVMVSTSPDNSIKVWIFDLPDGSPRVLRERGGHSLPPTHVRFYGLDGRNVLSSGGDSSLRAFNTVTEIQNKCLGKATFRKKKFKRNKNAVEDPLKMPPIAAFSSEITREKEWNNIVAIHSDVPEVTTWSFQNARPNSEKLLHDRFKHTKNFKHTYYKASATSVCITHCGNFAVVGYSSGHCDRFNIQSGIHRGAYGGGETAHDGPVRGVAVDVLNLFLTTGGGDKKIKWWNFKNVDKAAAFEITLDEGVSFFAYHLESALLAVALENFAIVLIDNEGRNVVRKFEGHYGRINDICMSPDSKWLISAGMDCAILTWDIPSGSLVDQFKVDAPCTSLSFSPTSEFLATTHVDFLGVFLWTNRTLYSHVSLKPLTGREEIPTMSLPSTTIEASQAVANEEEEGDAVEDEMDLLSRQIRDMVTLSDLDASKWRNLLHLDVIRERNKPREALNVSQRAPFFLPTIPSIDVKFDLSDAKSDSQIEKVKIDFLDGLTSFGKFLKETDDLAGAFDRLKQMGPTSIDFEINSLASGFDESRTLLARFLKMIKHVLDAKVDFELAQSYLALFLKVHGEEIVESELLLNSLREVEESQIASWRRVEENLFYNLSVIHALKM